MSIGHRAGLLIAGTSSDAGKSLLVAGLCRSLRRRGLNIAPFKAQNMSNNSMVCADGAEIGRAQYLQALAAGVTAEAAMNPVLLKPGTDRRSFVVVRGRPAGTLESGEYAIGRTHLAEAAYASYAELADRFDLVVCEGAGSPAEINLRRGDYVNMGLARRFNLPVVVVGDIDRGGVLASLFGTWALLEPADRALLRAFVINKFRGDQTVLEPGLSEITARTGVEFHGVMPWLNDVWLDGEDTLEVGRWRHETSGKPTTLTIAVVRLPRISNATDVDALAAEPGVEVRVTTDPGTCATADLVVLPGSRSTVGDLRWLRERGIADAVIERARAGRPVLGICGGYQMLAHTIEDEIESGAGSVPGLGLIPGTVRFDGEKVLALREGTWRGRPVCGYLIHHGRVDAAGEEFLGGVRHGQVWGTLWHGAFEGDEFRRAWLSELAETVGSSWRPDLGAMGYAARREAMVDRVADALETHTTLTDLAIEVAGQ